MPRFINTKGEATLGIAICSRCQKKRKLADLVSDGNIPNFMVCRSDLSPGCWDHFDPMRLPPRAPDKYNLPFVRPDQDITMSEAAQLEAGLPILPPFPDGE
jgi:hypothetical protein